MKVKIGDKVQLKGYIGIVEIDGIDEMLTSMLKKKYYTGVDVDYLEGKRKVNNCEPFSIDDIEYIK
jgi:hypothetical protein